MDGPFAGFLRFIIVLGLFATAFGGFRCVQGHIYSVAAQREATTVGRVVGIYRGKSPAYHYVFFVNGVKMDDSSEICVTPLVPGACDKNGPVLVYYSYQPFSNSRLEDFTIASSKAYRTGEIALAIGLPLLALFCADIAMQARKGDRKTDSDPQYGEGPSDLSAVPDDLHIAPRE